MHISRSADIQVYLLLAVWLGKVIRHFEAVFRSISCQANQECYFLGIST